MFGRVDFSAFLCVKFTHNIMAKVNLDNLIWKLALMVLITLLLLIPLGMIKSLIRERQDNADSSRAEVARSWALQQTLSGPELIFYRERTEQEKKDEKKTLHETLSIYPEKLSYEVDAATQDLHRAIYEVKVYTADIVASGTFLLPENCRDFQLKTEFSLGLYDLRGIEGAVNLSIGGRDYSVTEGGIQAIRTEIKLDPASFGSGREIPFEIRFRARGSEAIYFQPFGQVTEVTLRTDCGNPSFEGDFLPAEREIGEDGSSARWVVSAINRGKPQETKFGVKLLQGVSQYQQTTRSAKYGILIILLVFVAGLAVELVGKKSIHIIQYAVIGLSLVLFYALLLSFSELMVFWLAYLLAAGMTTAALTLYFRGILKDKKAWLLGALIAIAYVVCYILLQMETYALVAGTLILFILLVGIMYFTRELPTPTKEPSE